MQNNTKALGGSEKFLDFQEEIERLSKVDRPVLILGERGTGKELAAYNLHYLSKRWDKPYITFLCSALNPNLLEDALFGHEPGAFTGANTKSIGYFERANNGSIFLDEVADIPLATQDKLLRVLEYGTFERLGGQKTINVDIKIIAATNKDIFKLTDEGLFRADLLDRISFEVVSVPPLRERAEDILILARHFALEMALELNIKDELFFSDLAIEQLFNHAWFGNIRELKNAIERTVYRLNSIHITEVFINPVNKTKEIAYKDENQHLPADFNLLNNLAKVEKEYLDLALVKSKYKQKDAAKLLGLTYNQFRNIYRKYLS